MLLTFIALVTQAHALEIQGHRGARAVLPENTLPAFEYALSIGVDTLELDLAVTKDLKLIVSHDPHVNPMICQQSDGAKLESSGPLIFGMTLLEAKKYDCGTLKNPRFPKQKPVPGTPMPTLEEVFALVRDSKYPAARSVQFNIETKILPNEPANTTDPRTFATLVVNAIRKSGFLARSTLQSFDYRTLDEARKLERKLERKLRLVTLSENPSEDLVKTVRELRPYAMSPQWELLDAKKVKAIQALGSKVIPWTLNTEEAFAKVIAMGVDGIITDDPSELQAYLTRLKRQK
jgi:glycerophosphoryl diester phosphodiesterase